MAVHEPARTASGYEILRGAVSPEAIDAALRHIHLDMVMRGIAADTLGKWLWSAHWFPHLKWDAPIVALLEELPAELREGELCDPQIVLHPPDSAEDVEPVPHVDQEPDWANGRRYARIIGVALTAGRQEHGGLLVWPLDGGGPEPVEVEPGDAVAMDPALPHTSGLNRTGSIRYAVYFRLLPRAD